MPYLFVGQNGVNNGPGTWTNGTFTGNVTVGGTLGVTGATTLSSTLAAGASTLASLAVTAGATIGTTLGVTGASTLAAVSATTLNTSGLATLASASVTGAATVGTTLGVTGISSLTGGVATPLSYKTGGVTVSNVDVGGFNVPASINPSTYFVAEEFDRPFATYSAFGSNGTNVNLAIPNALTAPVLGTSNISGAYVATSSTTQGGSIAAAATLNIVKSTTINYQWRLLFYVGTLSDATNPYTLLVGAYVTTNATAAAHLPVTGPYMSYTHTANAGRWVLGTATNSVRITSNTTTAVASGWHTLTITLANGVYTFVLNGASIGTVTDTNMSTSVTSAQGASIGAISIVPDGAAWTTARSALIDRSDFYVTGLSR